MQAKHGKSFLLGYGMRRQLIKLFPKPDGTYMSDKSMWNILNFRTNSETAVEVRKYLTEQLRIKPRSMSI